MELKKIQIPSVRDEFVRQIENLIISGQFKIGDRLPSARELCEQMGVSLTVVNAGISELVAKGFLIVEPRHGTFVADYIKHGNLATLSSLMKFNGGRLDDYNIRSFCEYRIAVDPYAAKLVVERATDEQLKDLLPYLELLRFARTTKEISLSAVSFFNHMFELSDNSLITLIMNSTVDSQASIYEAYIDQNGPDGVYDHAKDIYNAVLSRDAELAGRLLVRNMTVCISGDTSVLGKSAAGIC